MSLAEQKQLNLSSIHEGKLTWIYIERPSSGEVEFLAKHFDFHPLNLDDVLSRAQRPKIDEYDDHLFIVLQFPVFDKENRITRPSEVDIFVGESYLVTVHCNADLKPLARFFRECQTSDKSRTRYLGRSSGFLLYHILDRLINYCFPILTKITDNIDDIEEVIFAKAVPETVRQISLIRRDLISFRRVVRPQISVIETLESEEYPFIKEEQDIYFGDIADHVRRIWDGLEESKEVVDGLAETSNWLTSHRIQEIMQVLTIVMAMLAPPTLLSGIYGMNIPLPGGVESGSLVPLGILFAIMAVVGAAMFAYLRRRGWI
ncbi:MAG: magnesium transporter CorA family protein [Chloroflexi bacterium]|nr:magnesium transporter CorA family protein [Chloroflexota bacterium]MCK4262483.1 magnesium transporter CorA family protein [Dehalococcoidia bacterium]MCK4580946.1 magnesium transporter CorA family protein [Dehalococcoidia bacterium]